MFAVVMCFKKGCENAGVTCLILWVAWGTRDDEVESLSCCCSSVLLECILVAPVATQIKVLQRTSVMLPARSMLLTVLV